MLERTRALITDHTPAIQKHKLHSFASSRKYHVQLASIFTPPVYIRRSVEEAWPHCAVGRSINGWFSSPGTLKKHCFMGSAMTTGCFPLELESINNTTAFRRVSSASVYIVACASVLRKSREDGFLSLKERGCGLLQLCE